MTKDSEDGPRRLYEEGERVRLTRDCNGARAGARGLVHSDAHAGDARVTVVIGGTPCDLPIDAVERDAGEPPPVVPAEGSPVVVEPAPAPAPAPAPPPVAPPAPAPVAPRVEPGRVLLLVTVFMFAAVLLVQLARLAIVGSDVTGHDVYVSVLYCGISLTMASAILYVLHMTKLAALESGAATALQVGFFTSILGTAAAIFAGVKTKDFSRPEAGGVAPVPTLATCALSMASLTGTPGVPLAINELGRRAEFERAFREATTAEKAAADTAAVHSALVRIVESERRVKLEKVHWWCHEATKFFADQGDAARADRWRLNTAVMVLAEHTGERRTEAGIAKVREQLTPLDQCGGSKDLAADERARACRLLSQAQMYLAKPPGSIDWTASTLQAAIGAAQRAVRLGPDDLDSAQQLLACWCARADGIGQTLDTEDLASLREALAAHARLLARVDINAREIRAERRIPHLHARAAGTFCVALWEQRLPTGPSGAARMTVTLAELKSAVSWLREVIAATDNNAAFRRAEVEARTDLARLLLLVHHLERRLQSSDAVSTFEQCVTEVRDAAERSGAWDLRQLRRVIAQDWLTKQLGDEARLRLEKAARLE